MKTLLAAAILFSLPIQDSPGWKERLREASKSTQNWDARRREIRERILVSAGLWPEFERPVIKPVIDGRLEREGYTIERVRLETLPGFYLTGNLYRPRDRKGPFPGIVTPHGHHRAGRYAHDDKIKSVPGRCIHLARMGFVVFSYDMVGFGDSRQLGHRFADHDWGLDLLGLQLWNSLYAVDFLTALDDVDPKRIGATGASGGGTQTYLLAAVDKRIRVSVPVNMVAAEFQGGCPCENAPFLRIGLNNVEIAAAAAPRPLLLVSCTGDWTKHTLKLEGPAVQKVYDALGKPERFRAVQFKADHNYNRDSREAMYAWMARWLQGAEDRRRIPEKPFEVEKREDLKVPVPKDAANEKAVAESLREMIRAQLAALEKQPDKLRKVMRTAYRHVFSAEWPQKPEVKWEWKNGAEGKRATILVVDSFDKDGELVKGLVARGEPVFVLKRRKHEREKPAGGTKGQQKRYAKTFFRTAFAWNVRDVLHALAALRAKFGEVRLVGGRPALFARAMAPKNIGLAVIDTSGGDLPHPYMKRLGGVRIAEAVLSKETVRVSAKGWTAAEILKSLK